MISSPKNILGYTQRFENCSWKAEFSCHTAGCSEKMRQRRIYNEYTKVRKHEKERKISCFRDQITVIVVN